MSESARSIWKQVVVVGGSCTFIGVSYFVIWKLQLASQGIDVSWTRAWREILLWNCWGLMWPLVLKITHRLPFSRKGPKWNLLVHLPASLIIPFLFYGLYLLIAALLLGMGQLATEPPLDLATIGADSRRRLFSFYFSGTGLILGFLLYGSFVAIAYARAYYKSFRAEELKNLQLKTQLMQAELHALKMQLHPHFLFNTLNSISALLQTDVKAADNMLTRLGDFWRLTLEHANRMKVTLEEEVQFITCYLDIEQLRFADRLTLQYDIADELKAMLVPNLILQPLVENALRYGIAKRMAPGWIRIRAQRNQGHLCLEVQDSGPGWDQRSGLNGTNGEGVGLSNTRARLEQLYGKDQRLHYENVEEGGFLVRVELPLEWGRKSVAAYA